MSLPWIIGIDTYTACDSLTWIDGNTYFENNSTALHTLLSSNGCDSVVRLDLTINKTTYAIDSVIECFSFTWIDGNTYTENNNTATYTLINSHACDSVVSLNLVINRIDVSTRTVNTTMFANESDATYQWLEADNFYLPILGATDSSYKAYNNGEYVVEISKYGCVDTTSTIVLYNMGISISRLNSKIRYYPNPTKSELNLDFSKVHDKILINVRDVLGNIVQSKTFRNMKKVKLSINGIKGMYLIEVVIKDERIVFQILKQ